MKKIAVLLFAFALSGCASYIYQDAKTSEFTQANYDALEKLMANAVVPIDRNTPILVATVVNIDNLNYLLALAACYLSTTSLAWHNLDSMSLK